VHNLRLLFEVGRDRIKAFPDDRTLSTTDRGCCFLMQAMLPGGFPFHQFSIFLTTTCILLSRYLYRDFMYITTKNSMFHEIYFLTKNSY